MKKLFILTLASILLVCCSKDSLENDMSKSSCIGIQVDDANTTRGTTTVDDSTMNTAGMYCAYTASADWSTTTTFAKMDNDKYTYNNTTSEWVPENEKYWGFSNVCDKYTFYAYSPYKTNSNGINPEIIDGEMHIRYTVPNTCADQSDLIIARPRKNICRTSDGKVPMVFEHALSKISFSAKGHAARKITSITITSVINSGTATHKDTIIWANDASVNDFTVSAEDGDITDNRLINGDAENITNDDGYLFMIPQTIAAGTEVILSTVDAAGDDPATSILKFGTDQIWKAGRSYNYEIDVKANIVRLFDEKEISNCYMVNSFDEKEIYIIPITERINDFWTNYAIPAEGIQVTDESTDLRAQLIWHDCDGAPKIKVEVIDEPSYSVGNKKALKVTWDTRADKRDGNILVAVYRDLDGNDTITYRKETSGTLKDIIVNDEVVWSWHFWVTDYTPDILAEENKDYIVPNTDKAYTFSGCEGALHRYKDIDNTKKMWSDDGLYKDKFIMDRNLGARDATFEGQGGGSLGRAGVLYYEFGRKDPFPGLNAKLSDGSPYEIPANRAKFKGEVMLTRNFTNPTIEDNYTDYPSTNILWHDKNASITSNKKSIFDPSPLGWMVPQAEVWNNLLTNNTIKNCEFTGVDYVIYNNLALYPTLGYVNPNSSLISRYTEIGGYWSATPYSNTHAYRLLILTGNKTVNPKIEYHFIDGQPVRCIQE